MKIARTFVLLALCLCACASVHPGRPANYVVFFRYDSAELNSAGRQIVDQAAAAAKAIPAAKIEIAGYLDSATAAPTSRRFSAPRFNAVEQALIADGIDPKLFVRAQLADTESALPGTADRRIEIWLIGKGTTAPPYRGL